MVMLVVTRAEVYTIKAVDENIKVHQSGEGCSLGNVWSMKADLGVPQGGC